MAAQKAALWHAKTEFARYSGLLKEDAATQTEVDQWHYKSDAAQADLLSAEAQVVTRQAQPELHHGDRAV